MNFLRSDDDIEIEEHKYVPITEASTSSDYFNITAHPRFTQLQSESRRKTTPPIRIQQIPTPAQQLPPAPPQCSNTQQKSSVRVRGVIRDPSNSKCLYLLVDSTNS